MTGGKVRCARAPKQLPKSQGSYRGVLNGRKRGHACCSGRLLGGRSGAWHWKVANGSGSSGLRFTEIRARAQDGGQDVTGLGDRLRAGVGK